MILRLKITKNLTMRHFLTFATFLIINSCSLKAQDLKMNQVQVIGSHNSYKIGIEQPLQDLIVASRPEAKGLDYEHIPPVEQLDLGLRSLELDAVYDPEGGKFAHPKGLQTLNSFGTPTQPYDSEAMKDPGFKVLHIPDIDFRSHCLTFIGCLSDIKTWSQAHSDHLPIIITINPKNSGVSMPGYTKVIPFDKQVLEALDEEILEVFDVDELITPKLVKGKQKSLRNAIVNKGWPDLAEARGKVLFVLDAGTELNSLYVSADDDYENPMFSSVAAEHSHAAFFIMNNPKEQEAEISEMVKQGFMVRTRSDANTKEARTGDKTRFEAAMRSGAHVITTDYYLRSLSPNKDFQIDFEESYSRCNPILTDGFSDCNLKE